MNPEDYLYEISQDTHIDVMEGYERNLLVEIAKSYHGTFYTWGGDDPSGFDCSGLAIACLKSIGKLPRGGDWTAHDLSGRLTKVDRSPRLADLVFWQNSIGRIIHVEIMIDHVRAIGASGGGRFIKTKKDAILHNAFIKIRPVASRPNVWGYCDPWALEEG
jgi:cell wall-associated NlpC family hydrolase